MMTWKFLFADFFMVSQRVKGFYEGLKGIKKRKQELICPSMGKYGSQKNHILAYFMQCITGCSHPEVLSKKAILKSSGKLKAWHLGWILLFLKLQE